MKVPVATYRIQFSPDFTFSNFEKIIPYLSHFGISTIYAAPILQSRRGSTHGYDCINPHAINKEIGSVADLKQTIQNLNTRNMDWLQDIVPNHMALSGENIWIEELLELGSFSRFYDFFDIDWNYKNLEKVMAPFFGNSLKKVLAAKEIQLKFDVSGFSFQYFDQSYPASARSYFEVLLSAEIGIWLDKFENYPKEINAWRTLKAEFYKEIQKDADLKKELDSFLSEVNNSEDKLKKILELQYFLPQHWQSTEKEINYRRFFTINDLICLRMEEKKVFDFYHTYIKELCNEGLITGLRIDHVDGLFDPAGYLGQLRKLMGPEFYIVVEKILGKDEKMPVDWPIQGDTGYEFLAQVNQVFTQAANKNLFTSEYKKIAPEFANFETLIHEKKLFILKEKMGGELDNLWNFMVQNNLLPEEGNKPQLKGAFCDFMASFPVYRIYPKKFPLSEKERETLKTAYGKALKFRPQWKKEIDYFLALFLGKVDKDPQILLYFLQRCQQFTSPLAAKGAEDTVFYVYNRLLSHNEVGDSPENFGISVDEFHKKMQQRQQDFPLSMNATATHDTKRGEDARMRLNVLSELPKEWFEKVAEWRKNNQKFKKHGLGPDANEEYFIYQSLLGAVPFESDPEEDFLSRTIQYLQKMLREAKIHSNWAEPDQVYENAVFDFLNDIWEGANFKKSFDPFQKKIAFYGCIKSLGQCLLKITSPGVPDIYQGTELWDFNYVDPDNRRAVDYEVRAKYLTEIKNNGPNLKTNIKKFKDNYTTGQLKMYCLHKTLEVRREHPEIFESGDYIPVPISGKNSGQFLCFIRKNNEKWILVLVPVLVLGIFEPENFIPVPGILEDINLTLPNEAPKNWMSVYSQEQFNFEEGLDLQKLFRDFPVVLLKNNF